MINEKIFHEISETELVEVLKLCKPSLFQTETEIIYENHIPIASYLIVEGQVYIYKKKKLVQIIGSKNLIGIYQLMTKTPLKYSVKIEPGSRVCILDKSTIYELLNKIKENKFPSIFEDSVL